MAKVCILSIDYADFDKEFAVSLRIKGVSRLKTNSDDDDDDGTTIAANGKLRAAPELRENYNKWQERYRSLEGRHRGIIVGGTRTKTISQIQEECKESFDELVMSFREWLNCDQFRELQYELRTNLQPDEEVRVMVLTDNDLLRKMPWDTWDLLSRYKKAGVTIGPRRYQRPAKTVTTEKLKILAILGNRKNIDINHDLEILNQLPGAEVKFCPEPKRKEFEKLWHEKWDILFFAGHSWSKKAGETGYLYINQEERIEISEIEESLKEAAEKGLKLAIFNSCDGLGLAKKLEQMNIPQVIVWREPVPDMVAQKFLKKFLQEFSQGNSLDRAMTKAKAKLREASNLEKNYPGASWLPFISANPLAEPLQWPVISSPPETPPETNSESSLIPPPPKQNKTLFFTMGGIVIGAILLFFAYQTLLNKPTPQTKPKPQKVGWVMPTITPNYPQR
ncbi:CHAT domain-containing protein [Ancylothrix sp. C2]|uniref:CHAT domain-containing protein n=1 Tax=Ancylothrix sp. D3o TaxID=2953691 RepID=UPI0021BB5281|nr:CHAT domain-containing protein [Ancylothrix sp. D3o]MCT7952008.1 CHAT domain-containing protein [Ancylothrix sp. D3o]